MQKHSREMLLLLKQTARANIRAFVWEWSEGCGLRTGLQANSEYSELSSVDHQSKGPTLLQLYQQVSSWCLLEAHQHCSNWKLAQYIYEKYHIMEFLTYHMPWGQFGVQHLAQQSGIACNQTRQGLNHWSLVYQFINLLYLLSPTHACFLDRDIISVT